MKKLAIIIACLFSLCTATHAFAWHDKTHISIAQAAGYASWFNVAGPDITKTKAGNKEATNHWFNNRGGEEVTDSMVLSQVPRYNDAADTEGHLYGAIIAALRAYRADKKSGKYAEYNMAFCAHYIGDLSMPMHNAPYQGFLGKHHTINDGIIESTVMDNIGSIQKRMYTISLTSEQDLAKEIARLATISHHLALTLEKEQRDMTQEEAYVQVTHSASLLKAVLAFAAANR